MEKDYLSDYNNVKSRVNEIRLKYGFDISIETELLKYDYQQNINGDPIPYCIFKAEIKDKEGRLLARGHAREVEGVGTTTFIHFLEVCETSAVGRALVFAGLSEEKDPNVANKDDVNRAKDQKKIQEIEKKKEDAKKLAEKAAEDVKDIKGSLVKKVETKMNDLQKPKQYTKKDIAPFDNPKKGKRLKPEWEPIHAFLVKEDILKKIPDALVRTDIGFRTTQDFILKCTYEEFLTVINNIK